MRYMGAIFFLLDFLNWNLKRKQLVKSTVIESHYLPQLLSFHIRIFKTSYNNNTRSTLFYGCGKCIRCFMIKTNDFNCMKARIDMWQPTSYLSDVIKTKNPEKSRNVGRKVGTSLFPRSSLGSWKSIPPYNKRNYLFKLW